MNIEEVLRRKDILEEKIETLLNDFIDKTDVHIVDVFVWNGDTNNKEVGIELKDRKGDICWI